MVIHILLQKGDRKGGFFLDLAQQLPTTRMRSDYHGLASTPVLIKQQTSPWTSIIPNPAPLSLQALVLPGLGTRLPSANPNVPASSPSTLRMQRHHIINVFIYLILHIFILLTLYCKCVHTAITYTYHSLATYSMKKQG